MLAQLYKKELTEAVATEGDTSGRSSLASLTPHDLRHTAVALWIAAGANVLEVSRRAGHSSTSFTLDRYGHLFPEADTTVADRLEQLRIAR